MHGSLQTSHEIAVAVLRWGRGAQAPQILPGPLNLFRVIFDVIDSIVISLSRCCLPNEGPGPQIFFPRTAPARLIERLHATRT